MSSKTYYILDKIRPHYNVNLKSVEVGGQFLNLPTDLFDTGSSRGTIIDSGTTLAYLPSEVYQQLLDKVCNYIFILIKEI